VRANDTKGRNTDGLEAEGTRPECARTTTATPHEHTAPNSDRDDPAEVWPSTRLVAMARTHQRTRSELSSSAHLDRSSHHDVDLDSGHLRHRAEGAPDDRWDRLRLRRRKVNEVMSEPVRTTEPDEPLSGRARREQRKTRDRPKDLVVGDEVEVTGNRRGCIPAIRFMDLLTKRVTVAFTLGAELGAV
jgi:hypothetical protein